jgi:predicted nuclease with TOPRIM domain
MGLKKLNSKERLEQSKTRLALAFNRLEAVFEQKLNQAEPSSSEFEPLKEKLTLISKENEKLATSLSNLESDYHSIKLLSLEVMEELNTSITAIESILGSDDGSSRRNNS